MRNTSVVTLIALIALALAACATNPSSATSNCALRLATTTSTYDSGLLGYILPDFTQKYGCRVEVIAVGTGQALEIGARGDADVVLVHARASEDKFVGNGDARQRYDVMYNDFILVGPKSDPAQAAGASDAVEAFRRIASTAQPFASRGDKSGTQTAELAIWASASISPTKALPWYNSLGQGMGETLLFANEKPAYTLSDRGTYLAMKDKLPNLAIAFGGNSVKENKDPRLLNPYGVMAVNPDRHPGVKFDMAMNFVRWITSPATQALIGQFGVDRFGQPLFYPNATGSP